MGEFEIGGVVDGEGEAFGLGGGLCPGASGGFVIQGDGEVLEKGGLKGGAAAFGSGENIPVQRWRCAFHAVHASFIDAEALRGCVSNDTVRTYQRLVFGGD